MFYFYWMLYCFDRTLPWSWSFVRSKHKPAVNKSAEQSTIKIFRTSWFLFAPFLIGFFRFFSDAVECPTSDFPLRSRFRWRKHWNRVKWKVKIQNWKLKYRNKNSSEEFIFNASIWSCKTWSEKIDFKSFL